MALTKRTIIQQSDKINSLHFLKDKRLVSCSNNGIIAIYSLNTYQLDITIRNAHNDELGVLSIYGLENGNLASSGGKEIKIWEINRDEYKHLFTLFGHEELIYKIIELKDGKIASCSDDTTIRIWDNTNKHECLQILKGHTDYVRTILEMKNYIISAGYYYGFDNSVRIWNKSTYQCETVIEEVNCCSENAMSIFKDNTIIILGCNELFIIDIISFQYKILRIQTIIDGYSLNVLNDKKIILGNHQGIIVCFDETCTEIIFKNKVHNDNISCIIESEDNKIFSCSWDKTINLLN